MESMWERISPYAVMVHTELVEPRAYQINIAKSIYSKRNSLVVLPTGLGKTLIAILAMARALYEGKKAIMLAPTKPLSEQHYKTLSSLLNIDKESILLLTGSTHAKERKGLESTAKVIAATPQTIANDLKAGRIPMEEFGIVVFDECHKAVGKYAYTYIADECKLRGIQMVGLTASPGSSPKKIKTLVSELGIENIEIRISSDSDVSPYVMDKSTTVLYLQKNDAVERITGLLKPLINEHLQKLYSRGLSPFKSFDNLPKKRILDIGSTIQKIEARNYRFMAIFHYVYIINLAHAYELASVEGIYPFLSYMEGLQNREKKSRALQSILANKDVGLAIGTAREALKNGVEHPKMLKVVELAKGALSGKSAIVFAQYRSTIKKLVELLNSNGIEARAFIGKKEGITQAQQHDTIEDFRKGAFRVMVATSIGEEGLDIPSVDAVVFYEPIPSEIRAIQRRGRAGRIRIGYVVILVTRGTRDEVYLMISRTREKRMRETVESIRASLGRETYKNRISNSEAGQQALL